MTDDEALVNNLVHCVFTLCDVIEDLSANPVEMSSDDVQAFCRRTVARFRKAMLDVGIERYGSPN